MLELPHRLARPARRPTATRSKEVGDPLCRERCDLVQRTDGPSELQHIHSGVAAVKKERIGQEKRLDRSSVSSCVTKVSNASFDSILFSE